jgi:hypothetical protein
MGTIKETDLLGKVFFETSPNTGTATWTDHTATASRMYLTRGGSATAIGISDVEVGSAVITLVDNTATIGIGYWVRVRTLSGNVWAGYVQDIETDIEFINGVQYVVKTLYCLDWVAYVAQFIFPFCTALEAGGTSISAVPYAASKRINAFNFNIDATGETQLVSRTGDSSAVVGHSDRVGSLAEHLDLLANTVGSVWNATTATPTNGTTGRDGLVSFYSSAFLPETGLVFSDGSHPSGTPLYYQGLTIGQSSRSIANTVLVKNSAQLALTSSDVTYNPDFVYDHEYTRVNSSSVTSYGSRQVSVETNLGLLVGSGLSANTQYRNRVQNPSFENGGNGWIIGDATAGVRFSVRKPSLDSSPFEAKSGSFALRARVVTAASLYDAKYYADDQDGIDVVAGESYGVSFWGAKSTTQSGFITPQVRWLNIDGGVISSSTGTNVTMVSANTWYQARNRFTAPAGAVKATLRLYWERPSGNWSVGTRLWIDDVTFHRMENASDWYENNGLFKIDLTTINFPLGTSGASESVTVPNVLSTRGGTLVSTNSEPRTAYKTLTWNAQNDLTKVHLLDLNKSVLIWRNGSSSRVGVEGIQHEITKDKWIVQFDLSEKKTFLPI